MAFLDNLTRQLFTGKREGDVVLCDIVVYGAGIGVYGKALRDTLVGGKLIKPGEVCLLYGFGDDFIIADREIASNDEVEPLVRSVLVSYANKVTNHDFDNPGKEITPDFQFYGYQISIQRWSLENAPYFMRGVLRMLPCPP